jgi:uncharacterized protein (DUF736 family)
MEYDNTNRGALFSNKDRASDNHPHARGSIDVGGVEYWISAWTKTDKNGNKYQSLSVTPKEPMQAVAQQAPQTSQDDFEDDIPF